MIGYVVTYVVPFLVTPADDWRKWIGMLIFFVVICILHIRLNMVYTNPLLAFAGYYLYEITTDRGVVYPLITRRTIVRPGTLSVVKIGENVTVEAPDDDGDAKHSKC